MAEATDPAIAAGPHAEIRLSHAAVLNNFSPSIFAVEPTERGGGMNPQHVVLAGLLPNLAGLRAVTGSSLVNAAVYPPGLLHATVGTIPTLEDPPDDDALWRIHGKSLTNLYAIIEEVGRRVDDEMRQSCTLGDPRLLTSKDALIVAGDASDAALNLRQQVLQAAEAEGVPLTPGRGYWTTCARWLGPFAEHNQMVGVADWMERIQRRLYGGPIDGLVAGVLVVNTDGSIRLIHEHRYLFAV